MPISKNRIAEYHFQIDNKDIERVHKYKYLVTTLNDQWEHSREIKIRIESVTVMFNQISVLSKSHYLTRVTKARRLRC